jgi:hypothetical protein
LPDQDGLHPFRPTITTDTPAVEIFIEVATASQETANRLTARACDAIDDPTRCPEVRAALAELLAVLDRDGWI